MLNAQHNVRELSKVLENSLEARFVAELGVNQRRESYGDGVDPEAEDVFFDAAVGDDVLVAERLCEGS